MENKIRCPKCGSDQLTAVRKGFSGKKAVAGALLTGGIGVLAGTIGSNKIKVVCLNCGHEFKPGQNKVQTAAGQPKMIWDEKQQKHVLNPNYNKSDKTAAIIMTIITVIVIVVILMKILK